MPHPFDAVLVIAFGGPQGPDDIRPFLAGIPDVPVVGDAVSPFMAPPDTDPAALRAADSLLVLPGDPPAAVEELLPTRCLRCRIVIEAVDTYCAACGTPLLTTGG